MVSIIKSVSIPMETWVAFSEVYASINFSKWVTEQMQKSLKPKHKIPSPMDQVRQSTEKKAPSAPVESEEEAFIRGVEEYLERGEKLPERTMEEYKRKKEELQDD